MAYTVEYPRPDFERPNLRWQPLDGAWDFLYDDSDVGLDDKWYLQSLPTQVEPTAGGAVHQKRVIQVPFAFQTVASGIGDKDAHEVLWYERMVTDVRAHGNHDSGHRLLLRFGAVDYEASVWVNGTFLGDHRGGHVPFEIDITSAVSAQESLRVTVRVRDSPYDLTQPRGKQFWGPEPEGIFYTPTSGIWQPVWLESVPKMRLGDSSHGTVFRCNNLQSGELQSRIAVLGRRDGSKCRVEVMASIGGMRVAASEVELTNHDKFAELDLDLRLAPDKIDEVQRAATQLYGTQSDMCWQNRLALWAPEHPILYELRLRLFDGKDSLVDEVKTVTGVRTLSYTSGDGSFRLNGKPYFHALVLDQGYWPETGLTPPFQGALRSDIELSKNMGFNGCRKHQKVEDPLFLYWADRLGFMVWGEMANAYEFNAEYVERFDLEWLEAVKRDINHPCVVAWTPTNESWGYPGLGDSTEQRNHIRSIYFATKYGPCYSQPCLSTNILDRTLDPDRPVNDNCGWEHVCTDLTTFHDYSDGPALESACSSMKSILSPHGGRAVFVGPMQDEKGLPMLSEHRHGAPVLCTEFGGVNIAPAKDSTSEKSRDWGYTTAADPDDLLRRIERLFMAVVKGGHCCGFVYTQL